MLEVLIINYIKFNTMERLQELIGKTLTKVEDYNNESMVILREINFD